MTRASEPGPCPVTLPGATTSMARKMGSASMTIPAPPPNGLSSVVRCVSSVWSRRLVVTTSSRPRSRAMRIMPRSSAGAQYSGKMVSRSMRMDGLLVGRLAIDVEEPLGKPHEDLGRGGVPSENGARMIRDQNLARLPLDHEDLVGARGHDVAHAPDGAPAFLDDF